MPPLNAIVIFAKPPEPGRVKTRLLGELNPSQAANLHRTCLEDTVALVDSLPGCARWLLVAGGAAAAHQLAGEIQLGRGWRIVAQRGRDLGARLERALRGLFAAGTRKAVVVGTDTPWMGRSRLREALRLLDSADIVLGPAADGGYYLLGARRLVPQMFRGIPWGHSQVCDTTLRTLARVRASYRLLQRDFDLDRPQDLQRIAEKLKTEGASAPALVRWMMRWDKGSGND